MSKFEGVIVSDQLLQSQFTQVELRSLKSKFISFKNQNGKVTYGDLPSLMMKLKAFIDMYSEDEIRGILNESRNDFTTNVDFEAFLMVYLNLRNQATTKQGGLKHSSSFLNESITTLLHTISGSEKGFYVAHINSYLGDDPFLISLSMLLCLGL